MENGNGIGDPHQNSVEDYYYSDSAENAQAQTEESLASYYSNAPFSRYEFIRSVDYKSKLRNIRIVGIVMLVFLIIDFIKVYRANYEYELDNQVWLNAFLSLCIIVTQVLIQMYSSNKLSVVQLFLVIILMIRNANLLLYGLFLQPVGFIPLIFAAFQIEQTAFLEKKWKLYKSINIDKTANADDLI